MQCGFVDSALGEWKLYRNSRAKRRKSFTLYENRTARNKKQKKKKTKTKKKSPSGTRAFQREGPACSFDCSAVSGSYPLLGPSRPQASPWVPPGPLLRCPMKGRGILVDRQPC